MHPWRLLSHSGPRARTEPLVLLCLPLLPLLVLICQFLRLVLCQPRIHAHQSLPHLQTRPAPRLQECLRALQVSVLERGRCDSSAVNLRTSTVQGLSNNASFCMETRQLDEAKAPKDEDLACTLRARGSTPGSSYTC